MLFWAIVATAVALLFGIFPLLDHLYGFDAYRSFIRHELIAPIAVGIGLPVGVFFALRYDSQRRRIAALLIWLAVAGLAIAAIAAVRNARDYHFHNCWTIRAYDQGDSHVEIQECTPDGGHPEEYAGYDPNREEGQSRYCTQESTSSSRGTVWRCVTQRY